MNGNEPTFPVPEYYRSLGLTKRELFAAMAMQGYTANTIFHQDNMAQWCVKCADALLAELAKPKVEVKNDE